MASAFTFTTGFSSNVDKTVTIKKEVLQVLDCSDLNQDVINLYEQTGWIYNATDNRLERNVKYSGEPVSVEGKSYVTDSKGEVTVNTNPNKDGALDVTTESTTDGTKNTQAVSQSQLSDGKTVVVQETVDMGQIIENMDDQALNAEESAATLSTSADVQVGGLSNGQLPKHGQYVHCNRFNGYLGNGRYYSKTANPVMAARNFVQSDCDVALAKSTHCLADYGSNPYCSTKSKTTAGKCSANIVKHSRLYHKHTGWFSPSK